MAKGRKKKSTGTSPTVILGQHNTAKQHENSESEEEILEKARELESKSKPKGPKKDSAFQFNFEPSSKEETEEPSLFKFNLGGQERTFDFSQPNEGLVKLFQKKLSTLVGEDSGYFDSLPIPIRNRVEALKRLHEKKIEIEKVLKQERLELERKYEEQFQQLFHQRVDIVSGKVEPTPEQSGAKVFLVEDEISDQAPAESQEGSDGIPSFWLVVLKHHDTSESMIQEYDEEALTYLTDIVYMPVQDETETLSPESFELEFHFAENPFFTNKILSKKYYLKEDPKIGQVFYDHFVCTPINWKEGKNLTVETVVKKTKGGRGRGRVSRKPKQVETTQIRPSFFHFFSDDILDPTIHEDPDEFAEEDYEYAVELKEKVIPNAVLWFTGEIEGESMTDYEYEDEYEDEDEDEEEEEQEEEEEIEGKPAYEQAQAPDCKQQ
jgi:nucleosome assembly protein 1-like 1